MASLRSEDEVETAVKLWVSHEFAQLFRDGLVKLLDLWRRCHGGCVVGNNLTEVNSKVSVGYHSWFY